MHSTFLNTWLISLMILTLKCHWRKENQSINCYIFYFWNWSFKSPCALGSGSMVCSSSCLLPLLLSVGDFRSLLNPELSVPFKHQAEVENWIHSSVVISTDGHKEALLISLQWSFSLTLAVKPVCLDSVATQTCCPTLSI